MSELTPPVVILDKPQLADNIGAVARVMANFGLSELRLVAPRDGWPQDRAWATASGADWVLDGVKVFDSVAEAIADLNTVFSTTARPRETDPGKRAWYREDRLRREALILRDMGYLGHYVGDGAQPHHTTIHYNGWSRDAPNPEGFTTSRQTHGAFEGAFTARVARLDAVEAAMTAPALDGFDLRARVPAYLKTTLAEVLPFYRLERAGAFQDTDARGAAFVTARLAAGASELRDLFVLAWRDSADDSIGWPTVKVAEVEAGTADPWLAMYGED